MTGNSFLVDLILLLIIGISVFVSAKRGFVATVIGAVGFFLAIVLSLTICTPLANAAYDKLVEPALVETVADEVEEKFEAELNDALGENTDVQKLDEVMTEIAASSEELIASMPWYVRNYIEQSGLNTDELFSNTSETVTPEDTVRNASEKVAVNISQTKIKPMVASVIATAFSVLLFVLFLIVFKLLGGIINKLFSFSIVGKLNSILGGVCGLVKGVVVAIIFCTVIYAIVSFTKNGIWIFNLENFEHTILFKLLLSLIKI